MKRKRIGDRIREKPRDICSGQLSKVYRLEYQRNKRGLVIDKEEVLGV